MKVLKISVVSRVLKLFVLSCKSSYDDLFQVIAVLPIPWLLLVRGGDPEGTGGTPPKKFEVGDGPCIGTPNILRSSVVGWARKLEQSKKIGVVKEFFSEIVLFLVKKGSYMTFYTIKIRRI